MYVQMRRVLINKKETYIEQQAGDWIAVAAAAIAAVAAVVL